MYFIKTIKTIQMKKLWIGLMGVDNDGTMYTPSGKKLFRLPLRLSSIIQSLQHKIARLTHN